MVFGLIPAGGQSSRMGRSKLALPLGSRTVLGRVIDALHQGGVDHVVVVIGAHASELVFLAEEAGARVCRLTKDTPDMRATVAEGLEWLDRHFHPGPTAAFLLAPGDHPLLDATVVAKVLERHRAKPGYSLIVPTYKNKRGHPTLVSWRLVAGLKTFPKELGLNAYFRQFTETTLLVPVISADILIDLDTPEDYQNLQRRFSRHGSRERS